MNDNSCPMPPYSSLKRSTKPIRAKKKPLVRIGKVSGKVRLTGKKLLWLRFECYARDRTNCQQCGTKTYWMARFDGDPDAYDMAHRRNKRMHGDTLNNVVTKCHRCLMQEHSKGRA